MVVSEEKHIMITQKVIPTCIIILTFFGRFLIFYEYKGVTERNGWAAPIHFKIFFLIAIIMFFIGTWFRFNHNIVRVLLQISSLIIMLCCELLFWDFCELKIAYGFWINIILFTVLLIDCLIITRHSYTENIEMKS